MGSLFSRVSLGLQRSPSALDESSRWPTSDSIPTRFFSCPGADDYKVRGASYLTDRKKVPCHPLFPSFSPQVVSIHSNHQQLFLPQSLTYVPGISMASILTESTTAAGSFSADWEVSLGSMLCILPKASVVTATTPLPESPLDMFSQYGSDSTGTVHNQPPG